MNTINTLNLDDVLREWWEIKRQLEEYKALQERERYLRNIIGAAMFSQPKEGVNTADYRDGWKIKFTYKIDRKVDEAALPAVIAEMHKRMIRTDELIRTKHEVNLSPYRELQEEARKLFDTALIITPGSPSLEILPPKAV